ncbi:MAG: hypothetical protein JO180_12325 [Gemmatirosa sp.]|nr:hypothetical protein [Gemmatirosa sp.]
MASMYGIGGSIGIEGARGSLTLFSESSSPPPIERVIAAVVWSRPERHARRPARGERPRMPSHDWRNGPPEWMYSGSEDAMVEVHRTRRVIRLLGTEYALPTGDHMLVVLVDGAADPSAPTVRTHVLPCAPLPDRASDGDPHAAHMRLHAERLETWRRVADAHSDVAAFYASAGLA